MALTGQRSDTSDVSDIDALYHGSEINVRRIESFPFSSRRKRDNEVHLNGPSAAEATKVALR